MLELCFLAHIPVQLECEAIIEGKADCIFPRTAPSYYTLTTQDILRDITSAVSESGYFSLQTDKTTNMTVIKDDHYAQRF